MKVDIQSNINEQELTIETCSQIITMLQETYQSIREAMYKQFLGIHHLKNAIIVAMISLVIYFLTDQMFFIYAMPFIIIIFLLYSIIMAEYLTSQTRKAILMELEHIKKRKELLLKSQDDKMPLI